MEIQKLKDICLTEITDGTHQTPTYSEYGYIFLSSKNVTTQKIDWDNVMFIPEKLHEELYKRVAPQIDDILLAKNGTTGVAAIVDRDIVFDIYVSLALIRPNTEIVMPRYLLYAINNPVVKGYFDSSLKGIGVPNLHLKNIRETPIKIYDLETQKAIVEKIDKVCELISLRKQQLEKLDELVKARFVEMFGDPVKNTMDWEIKPLSELGELNRGVSKARPRNSPELLGGPYPLIQTGEVANAKTYITSFNSTYSEKGLAQSKMWPKGTLCITIAANIAQTSILTFDACFPDSVVGFISRNMTNELFIHYWFSFFQKILDEQAPQVAQKNINLKILSELNVIVPPLSLQNRFAAFVERVDQQKQTVQQSLEKLELMKKALMQEYFG